MTRHTREETLSRLGKLQNSDYHDSSRDGNKHNKKDLIRVIKTWFLNLRVISLYSNDNNLVINKTTPFIVQLLITVSCP